MATQKFTMKHMKSMKFFFLLAKKIFKSFMSFMVRSVCVYFAVLFVDSCERLPFFTNNSCLFVSIRGSNALNGYDFGLWISSWTRLSWRAKFVGLDTLSERIMTMKRPRNTATFGCRKKWCA